MHANDTFSSGKCESNVWTGNANEVVYTYNPIATSGHVRIQSLVITVADPLPVLSMDYNYNDNQTSVTFTVTPTQEDTYIYYFFDDDEEPMGMVENGTATIAAAPAQFNEQGIAHFLVTFREYDENMTLVAENGVEVDLLNPANLPAELTIGTEYIHNSSACIISVTPTQEEGTMMYWTNEEGGEPMGMLEDGKATIAYTPGLGEEAGVQTVNVYVYEVEVDADFNMGNVVATGFEQVQLVAPIEENTFDGCSAEQPIALADGWSVVNRDELGMDEANNTYFTYTAAKDGVFTFVCAPGNIGAIDLDEVEAPAGIRGTAYGKTVKAGDVVAFSAVLPAVYAGVEDDELYDITEYNIYAEVIPTAPATGFFVATPIEEVGAEGAYLYNVDAQAFMTKGEPWGTRVCYTNGEANMLMRFTAVDGKETYRLEDLKGDSWSQLDCDKNKESWIDGDGRQGSDAWSYQVAEDGTFTITNSFATGYFSVVPSISDSQIHFSDAADAQSRWIFVTPEAYEAGKEAYLAAGILANAKKIVLQVNNFLNGTNVYTQEAYDAFVAKYPVQDWMAACEDETIDYNDVANVLSEIGLTTTGWHASITADDLLLSAWTIGEEPVQCQDFNTALYINTWSTEGNNDGSDFRVPFYEYWTGDDASLKANIMTATVTGLTPGGRYKVSTWTRTRIKNKANAPAYGISFKVGDGEAVNACPSTQVGNSQMYLDYIYATGKADAEGNLTISYIVAEDNNVSWLSWQNVYYDVDLTPAELPMDYTYNEDQTTVTFTLTPTQEGTTILYFFDDIEEAMGMVENEDGTVTIAAAPGQFNEQGIAHFLVTFREYAGEQLVAENGTEVDLLDPNSVTAEATFYQPTELVVGNTYEAG
ncbi:MAG: hypothetical protein HUK02_10040, partial [Bacteroidaceae bacterium]|nr:hypothetical protein [Bacteroidaceae bacterium]